MVDHHNHHDEQAARNIKLAILLGLIAASVYGGYILAYYF